MSISSPPIAPQLMLPAPNVVALLPATVQAPEPPPIRPAVVIVEQAPRSRPKLSHLSRRLVVDEMEELFDQMLGFLSGDVSETDFHAVTLSFYKHIVNVAASPAEKPPRPPKPPRNPFASTPRDDAFDPSQMDARIRAAYERGYNRVH